MNQGIEIILARMDSNPEEFGNNASRGGRWHYLLAPLLGEDRPKQSWATPEEIEAVRTKYYSIQGETFTKNVLKELLEDEPRVTNEPKAWLGTISDQPTFISERPTFNTNSVLSTLGRVDIEQAYNTVMARMNHGLRMNRRRGKEDK